MNELFVTYSWESEDHNNKVVEFVNFLRKSGFDAKMDKMLIQVESAIDFTKMMHKIMTDYRKVIIILSENYKQKAEGFAGGVGNEYALIIKDINQNPNKYILVAFEKISNKIIPLSLQSREVVDLSKEENTRILFHKLEEKPLTAFSPVGNTKPNLHTSKSTDFSFEKSDKAITIEGLFNESGSSASAAGIYSFSSNNFWVVIKNSSNSSVEGFSIEISLPAALLPYRRTNPYEQGFSKNEERLVKSLSSNQKLFPNQNYISEKFEIEINNSNIFRIQDEDIIITVHSDFGPTTKSFKISDRFIVNMNYGQPQKLNDVAFG